VYWLTQPITLAKSGKRCAPYKTLYSAAVAGRTSARQFIPQDDSLLLASSLTNDKEDRREHHDEHG
jgi:hypothetical protein